MRLALLSCLSAEKENFCSGYPSVTIIGTTRRGQPARADHIAFARKPQVSYNVLTIVLTMSATFCRYRFCFSLPRLCLLYVLSCLLLVLWLTCFVAGMLNLLYQTRAFFVCLSPFMTLFSPAWILLMMRSTRRSSVDSIVLGVGSFTWGVESPASPPIGSCLVDEEI